MVSLDPVKYTLHLSIPNLKYALGPATMVEVLILIFSLLMTLLKKTAIRPGEMAQELRVKAALAKDVSLVPSIHFGWSTPLRTPAPWDLTSSSLQGNLHI